MSIALRARALIHSFSFSVQFRAKSANATRYRTLFSPNYRIWKITIWFFFLYCIFLCPQRSSDEPVAVTDSAYCNEWKILLFNFDANAGEVDFFSF